MASEHTHHFELKEWEDRNECAACGKEAVDIIGELEQQLADTREELRIALAQRQDYKADAAQARALLEEADTSIRNEWGGNWRRILDIANKIRAFLAQHKE